MRCVLCEIADTKQLINFHLQPNPKSWNKKEKGEVGDEQTFQLLKLREYRRDTPTIQDSTVPLRAAYHLNRDRRQSVSLLYN